MKVSFTVTGVTPNKVFSFTADGKPLAILTESQVDELEQTLDNVIDAYRDELDEAMNHLDDGDYVGPDDQELVYLSALDVNLTVEQIELFFAEVYTERTGFDLVEVHLNAKACAEAVFEELNAELEAN